MDEQSRRFTDRESLRSWLDANPPMDTDALGIHLLRSARLAAGGEVDCLLRWPKLAGSAGLDAIASLRSLAINGQAILDGQAEGDLAQAIIDAEDANCLRVLEPKHTDLLSSASSILDSWSHAAEHAVPSREVVEELQQHAEAWPLPTECRLGIVSEPIARDDLKFLAGLPKAPPIRIADDVTAALVDEEMALLDSGKPTRRLIDRFAQRTGTYGGDANGRFVVKGELDEWWGVRLLLDGPASAHVNSVRLGTMAMQRDPEDPELWSVRLHPLSLADRLRMVAMEFCIRMNDGTRLTL